MKTKMDRRNFILLLAALPFGGCTASQIQRGVSSAGHVLSGDVAGAVGRYIPTTGMPVVDQMLRDQLNSLAREIARLWQDKKVASKKEYVKYTHAYRSRAVVNFVQGRVRVETVEEEDPRQKLKEAIVTTLLTPEDPGKVDLLSDKEITGQGRPFLYGLVADHDGKFIRWSWRARRYADYLLENALQTQERGEVKSYFVDFAMVREHQAQQQLKFQHLVMQNARRFNQPPALIYAVMEAESSFNPYAMSHIPAYGLMQIVPTSAGRDVHQLLYGREGTPSREYLFVPENNIRMGAAYLHLLESRYLRKVKDPASRRYCVIAAYNTGSGNVLKAFAPNNNNLALNRINSLGPSEVYAHLVHNLPHQETRNYLPKVVGLQEKYLEIR